MKIALIGGLDRHKAAIAERAAASGHEAEFHCGRVGGRGAEELEAIVHRSDLVIIVTQVNSHGAVVIAKKTATRAMRPSVIVRTCGPSRFALILLGVRSTCRAARHAKEGAGESWSSSDDRLPRAQRC